MAENNESCFSCFVHFVARTLCRFRFLLYRRKNTFIIVALGHRHCDIISNMNFPFRAFNKLTRTIRNLSNESDNFYMKNLA